jgi:hypothetical protein
MYKTSIKERYRKDFAGFWKSDVRDQQYSILLTMGNMSLMYCEETGLLLDIYNNKLEIFKKVPEIEMEVRVEAKNIDYADRFDLQGEYVLRGFDSEEHKPNLLVLRSDEGDLRRILPSRLRVVSIKPKE